MFFNYVNVSNWPKLRIHRTRKISLDNCHLKIDGFGKIKVSSWPVAIYSSHFPQRRAFFLAVTQNNASVLSRRSNNEALRRNDGENSPNDRARNMNIQENFLAVAARSSSIGQNNANVPGWN
jgi:hypothetical protein